MAVLKVQVDWSSWDTRYDIKPVTLSDIESVNVKRSSEAKASTAEITLKNSSNRIIKGFDSPFTSYVSETNRLQFNEGDTVKIYAAYLETNDRDIDTSTGSADLIMVGEISEVNVRATSNGAKIKLSIVDKTWVMLNKLWSFNYNNTVGKTAPQIVQDVVRQVTDENSQELTAFDTLGNSTSGGNWQVDARLVSEGTTSLPGFIEDTRQDDTAFPATEIAKVFKPAYDFINDMSTIEYTNDFSAGGAAEDADDPPQDRKMIFYIDELNRFHWFYPKDGATSKLDGAINASVSTITLVSGTDFPSSGTIRIESEEITYTGKSTNDLTGCTRGVNNTTAATHSSATAVDTSLVFIEGSGTSGNKIINFDLKYATYDILNMVIYNAGQDLRGSGILDYQYDKNTKAKELKMVYKPYTDLAKNLIHHEILAGNLAKDNAQTDFTYDGNWYKAGAAYPITTEWGTSVANDTEYNTAVREKAKIEGDARALGLINKRGSPRWKGPIECRFKRYTPGDLIKFTSTRAGINQRELRIKTAQYNLTKTGGFVTLSVEEDEKRRGAS